MATLPDGKPLNVFILGPEADVQRVAELALIIPVALTWSRNPNEGVEKWGVLSRLGAVRTG